MFDVEDLEETLKQILDKKWFLEREYNRDIISALQGAPDNFLAAIVLKKNKDTNWLMLYLQPKRAA